MRETPYGRRYDRLLVNEREADGRDELERDLVLDGPSLDRRTVDSPASSH